MHIHEVLGPLFEVNFQDALPPVFTDFRKKYLKLARAKQLHGCYVQFSNHAGNTMDRTAYASPDHADPVGVYAYPIDYVLSHPADVWYGANARFLRVIKSTAKNVLILPQIEDERTVERLLKKAGYDYREVMTAFEVIGKHLKGRVSGPNRWAKTLLAAIQIDVLADPVDHEKPGIWSKGGPVYRTRTGIEQTALLRRMGFDAMEDRAKRQASAILNDREPEQIVFLSRGAFRVMEVFTLRGEAGEAGSLVKSEPDHPRTERPLVASIARIMNDTLSEGPERTDMGGYSVYWTKMGRRIEIMFDVPMSFYDNKKFGQKDHRQSKLSTPHRPRIIIHSELGKIERVFASTDSFADVRSSIARSWQTLSADPHPNGYKLQNKAGYLLDRKAASDAHIDAQIAKEQAQEREQWPTLAADITAVAQELGLPFSPDADNDDNFFFVREIKFFTSGLPIRGGAPVTKEQVTTELEFMEEHVFDAPRLIPLKPVWHQIVSIIWALYDRLGAKDFTLVASSREIFPAARRALETSVVP